MELDDTKTPDNTAALDKPRKLYMTTKLHKKRTSTSLEGIHTSVACLPSFEENY